MTPRVGIVLPNAGVAAGNIEADVLLKMVQEVDRDKRWAYSWVGDSLLSVQRLESTVLLAACAASTERVRLGVACEASLGFRDPFLFASQWIALDVISKGRVTLVACTGTSRTPASTVELEAYHLSFAEKVRRMEGAVSTLRTATLGEAISLDSASGVGRRFIMLPRSYQQPIPVWVVANPGGSEQPAVVRSSLERVARLGDGWMTFATAPEVLKERIADLLQMRRDQGLGSDGFPVCAYVDVNVNADERAAMVDAVATCVAEGRKNTSEEALRATAAIGNPTRCLRFLRGLVVAGVTDLALRPVSLDPLGQLRQIAELLLPAIAEGI